MEEIVGKENNDNLPPQAGDWVTVVGDEPLRRRIAHDLKSKQPFVVASVRGDVATVVSREQYKPGMAIPTSVSDIARSSLSMWGVSVKKLRIAPKPKIVSSDHE